MSSDKGKLEKTKKNAAARSQEPSLRCPRCDSPNTKFCYYNNYSLSQPRHFCKTCRRYWTKGGALRNVPIGGGCRKSKKMKCTEKEYGTDVGGLRFFQGISPAMDFQSASQFGDISTISATNPTATSFSLDPSSAGTSFGFQFKPANLTGFLQETGGSYRNLATSIESLSCMNQDLHWKLQQQRLTPNFTIPAIEAPPQAATSLQKCQPLVFQNLEITNSKHQQSEEVHNPNTEWFFDNPFATNWSSIQSWNEFP